MDRRTRNRRRALIAGTSALACTALLLVGLNQLFDHQEKQLAELARQVDPVTVPVVVAARTLHPGFEITEEDVRLVDMPPHLAPADGEGSLHMLVGRIPAERILEGDPVREARLADFTAARGLAALIPEGLRAISLNLANASAGSGFLLPGDRVDVQVTATIDGERKTEFLLDNVAVLAVDGSMTEESRKAGETHAVGRQAPAVTLLVTPEEALALTHGYREGALQLALRSRIDLEAVHARGVSIRDLLGRDPKPVARTRTPPPPGPEYGIFTIIRGPHSEEVLVDADGKTL